LLRFGICISPFVESLEGHLHYIIIHGVRLAVHELATTQEMIYVD